ncbi:MAG: hypothetical protein MUF13_11060 [Akkermansiaceae bacterium]|jgi:hypothetical protein|nr:hypothetical protein [Akkermansiaceae bacterium]
MEKIFTNYTYESVSCKLNPMKKNEKLSLFLSLALIFTSIGLGCYIVIYRPYVQLPREDLEFLGRMPMKSDVLKRFDSVDEELSSGERFQMTGWHPLPDRKVTGSAFSVVRRDGSKIYLFFDAEGRLEEYFISRS